MRIAWRQRLSLRDALFLFGALAILMWSVVPREQWLVDDAFIYDNFVRSSVSGPGFTYYGPLERVEGFSSPAWMLALVALAKLGLFHVQVARVLGVLVSIATMLVVALAPRDAAEKHRVTSIALLAAIGFALQPAVAAWATSGLDAPLPGLAAALIFAGACGRRPWMIAIGGALGSVSRPEGPILGIVAGVALFVHRSSGGAPVAARARALGRDAAVIVAPWMAWMIFRRITFGAFIANSARSKLVHDAIQEVGVPADPGAAYLLDAAKHFRGELAIVVALAIAAVVAWRRPARAEVLRVLVPLVALITAYVAFAWRVKGDWMPESRLLLPLVAATWASAAGFALASRGAVRTLAIAGLAIGVLANVERQREDWSYERHGWLETTPEWPRDRIPFVSAIPADGGSHVFARAIWRYTVPGDRVLHFDVGQSGFFASDVVILDQFGLVSKKEGDFLTGEMSRDEYRAHFQSQLPAVAFVMVARERWEPRSRVAAAVWDILNDAYRVEERGPYWGGLDRVVMVRKDIPRDRAGDAARWDDWQARAPGLRFYR